MRYAERRSMSPGTPLLARGQVAAFRDIFGGSRYFGSFLLAGAIYKLGAALGALLLILPGAIVWAGWSLRDSPETECPGWRRGARPARREEGA
jgi:hypothetical protein